MKHSSILRRGTVLLVGIACLLSGCGGVDKLPIPTSGSSTKPADFKPYEIPEFQDAVFHEDAAADYGAVKADTSCLEEGYIAIRATSGSRLKFQVVCGEMKYNYDISNEGETAILPLNVGDGTYEFKVMESVGDSKYTCTWSDVRTVTMADEFQPYLRPSQMVNYNENSNCVKKARELAADCQTDIEVVSAIYKFLCKHVKYDDDKAATVNKGYVPFPDDTLSSRKGICFDYASLAAAMMRSLGIPCRLITGYVDDEVYHAWNSFYIQEQGWVTVEIKATPNLWQRVDITFAAGGVSAKDLLNDGKYTTRFTY